MELKDKMRGAIVGFAYGDALGFGTEFMTRVEVKNYYPQGLTSFQQIVRDAHRSHRKRGEWTNETGSVLNLLDCILECDGFDLHALARKYKDTVINENVDLPAILTIVCNTTGWEENPIGTTHKVWQARKIKDASNEAIPRSMVTALACRKQDMVENTRKIVLMTNDDSRCVSTTLMIATMLHSLLYFDKEADYEELAEIGRTVDPRTLKYLELAHRGDIDAMGVDDDRTMNWARVSLGASLWGFWHGKDPTDAIHKVVSLGGDSDTNAALTGAMVGIRHGYDALPAEKEKLSGLDLLIDRADKLTAYIDKKWIR